MEITRSGHFRGRKGREWALISPDGTQLGACRWKAIDRGAQGLFQVSLENKEGFIDEQGNVVVPCEYDAAMGYWQI